MKKPRSSTTDTATEVADTSVSTDTASGDVAVDSSATAATAVSGAVEEIAARAGIAASELLAWQWRGERGLYVVTTDGRKIVVADEPTEAAR